jgi:hypothetical protein
VDLQGGNKVPTLRVLEDPRSARRPSAVSADLGSSVMSSSLDTLTSRALSLFIHSPLLHSVFIPRTNSNVRAYAVPHRSLLAFCRGVTSRVGFLILTTTHNRTKPPFRVPHLLCCWSIIEFHRGRASSVLRLLSWPSREVGGREVCQPIEPLLTMTR